MGFLGLREDMTEEKKLDLIVMVEYSRKKHSVKTDLFAKIKALVGKTWSFVQ